MTLMAPGSCVISPIPVPQPDRKSGHFSRHVFWHPTPRRWSLLDAKGPRQRATMYLALWPQKYCSLSLSQYLIYKAGDEAAILDDSIT